MSQLNFRPCKADPCVWLREMKDKYEYIAIYVDDLLIAFEEPQKIIQDLKGNSSSRSKVMDHWNTILVVTTNWTKMVH